MFPFSEFHREVFNFCGITFGDGETSATYRYRMFIPVVVYVYILICCDGVVGLCCLLSLV